MMQVRRFRYKVTETKGGADGYTNDKTKYQVDLAVQDRGAGAMEVTTTVTDVTHDPNNVVSTTEVSSGDSDDKKIAVIPFTNSYRASGNLGGQGSAKIEASKTLKGRAMKKDEFTFQVTNAMDTKEQKTVLAYRKERGGRSRKAGRSGLCRNQIHDRPAEAGRRERSGGEGEAMSIPISMWCPK